MEDIKIDITRFHPVSGQDVHNAAVAAQEQREVTYITADGERIAVIVPMPQPMPPRPAPPEPPWNDATALGQAQNGEANTAEWAEAWDYIEARLRGCDPALANARIADPYGPEPGDGDPGFAIPGTFVRNGYPGDINDPDRYPDDDYADEQDELEPDDYDPGPEIDDVGGTSEYPLVHPDAYKYGEPWGPGNPAPGSAWDTRRSEQEN